MSGGDGRIVSTEGDGRQIVAMCGWKLGRELKKPLCSGAEEGMLLMVTRADLLGIEGARAPWAARQAERLHTRADESGGPQVVLIGI